MSMFCKHCRREADPELHELHIEQSRDPDLPGEIVWHNDPPAGLDCWRNWNKVMNREVGVGLQLVHF